ncbi:hypothetical protein [Zavarzinella formosa]|uniref:hypothetical protein n=1 Tax=Zavarzinella formosa TaxID=360055 RepID=UPI00036EB902|nr:hypothetical protein [Zavarzinella formosa]
MWKKTPTAYAVGLLNDEVAGVALHRRNPHRSRSGALECEEVGLMMEESKKHVISQGKMP